MERHLSDNGLHRTDRMLIALSVLGGLAASIYSRYRQYLHYLLEYRDEQGMHIMLIHKGKTYAQYEVMIASPWGSSARGRGGNHGSWK